MIRSSRRLQRSSANEPGRKAVSPRWLEKEAGTGLALGPLSLSLLRTLGRFCGESVRVW
jgi:hypothetical protein